MSQITVEDLAKIVNERCETFRYFWAYGLLRETRSLWNAKDHQSMLCDTALIMLDQIDEIADRIFVL